MPVGQVTLALTCRFSRTAAAIALDTRAGLTIAGRELVDPHDESATAVAAPAATTCRPGTRPRWGAMLRLARHAHIGIKYPLLDRQRGLGISS
jgi:hypothetical protein